MAGPKKRIHAEPLEFPRWPKDRAKRRMRFIREYIITPRGHGAGKPFKLHPFQREIITGSFAPGIKQALISMPRGNGKSALAAALGVAELFVGGHSAEINVVASDIRQAGIIFDQARRMIELNPVLAERVYLYKDRIYCPSTDSTLRPLPAEYNALQGWDATLTIVDELHVVTPEVWEAVTSAAGKREESLILAISTPAMNKDCVMWGLVEYGRTESDPSFYLKEFSTPESYDIDDEEGWRVGNPAMSCKPPFLDVASMRAIRRTIREPRFRQLRLGQWVGQIDSWLPFDAWDKVRAPESVPTGAKVTLGFDGSASGDSTALVGCTVAEKPYLFVLGVWEKPEHSKDWRVPRKEVMQTINDAFKRFDVVEMAADPWGWRSELQELQEKHGSRKVVEYNTAFRKRMGAASDRFYSLVMNNGLAHDGNARLSAHIGNAVATETAEGTIITKDNRMSKRKIDLAVAAIVALDRASHHAKKKARVAAF